MNARVAVAFEFGVSRQQRQLVDARGGYDEFVAGIVVWKIRKADRFDDDVVCERQYADVLGHGGLEPRSEIHRQKEFSFLMFLGRFPQAKDAQPENFLRIA